MSTSCAVFASRKQLVLSAAFVALVALFVITVITVNEGHRKEIRVQQEKVHDEIVATTIDASSGSGLVRIRQAVTQTADGACTITVQRYVRRSRDDLFIFPPRIETLQCSDAAM